MKAAATRVTRNGRRNLTDLAVKAIKGGDLKALLEAITENLSAGADVSGARIIRYPSTASGTAEPDARVLAEIGGGAVPAFLAAPSGEHPILTVEVGGLVARQVIPDELGDLSVLEITFGGRQSLDEDDCVFLMDSARLLGAALRRREAEEAVQAQLQSVEERLRTALESTTDCVTILDRDWRIVFQNARSVALMNGGRDMIGVNFWEARPEAARATAWERYHKAMAEQVPVSFKDYYPPLAAWLEVHAYPSPETLTIFFRDVTEQRRTREALIESERRFRIITENIPHIVWTADADGALDYINPRFWEYSGLPDPERTLGWGWVSQVHPDDRETAIGEWERARAREGGHTAEFRIRRHDGEYRWHVVRSVPVHDLDGRVIKWFGTATDVDEAKRLQTALLTAMEHAERAQKEAERANSAKSRFLAAASHDLRQPVQSLMLFAGALAADQSLRNGQRKIMDHMQQSLDALKTLLDALLDISKLDAGIITPEIGEVPVRAVLSSLASQYAPKADAAGVELRAVTSDAVVRSDPVLLGRILRNLIENALRYTPRGRVLVGCRRRGDRLAIEVWDTGIGIPEGKRGEIFEEFVQVGNPARTREQGLGLGLAIVRRLSALLDHPVEVISTEGKGSLFRVLVPLAPARPRPDRPASFVPARDADPGTVLVIDDDLGVLTGLASTLRSWGYTVREAASAEEARALIRSEARRTDLILADYRLPGETTGLDLIRQIRASAGTPVPAALLTGDTDPALLRKVRRSRVRVLHKPISPEHLRATLGEMAAGD